VWVVAIPVPLPQRDACSTWVGGDGSTPVIVVAATTAGDRRRFSVAHELGHLVLHQIPHGSAHAVEQQADLFCRGLPPARAAMREVLGPDHLTTLADLKAHWGVSLQALIRRARTLELITRQSLSGALCPTGGPGLAGQEPSQCPWSDPGRSGNWRNCCMASRLTTHSSRRRPASTTLPARISSTPMPRGPEGVLSQVFLWTFVAYDRPLR